MKNIINFNDYTQKKSLSDEDIKGLLLGLVNLIKNNAIENVNSRLKEEFKENSIKLNNAKLEIKLKDEIINDLKKENENLTSKMNLLINKLNNLSNNSSIFKN